MTKPHFKLPVSTVGRMVVTEGSRTVCTTYGCDCEGEATAEAIAHALNCHDELVAVCYKVQKAFDGWDYEYPQLEASNAVDAILAKAKGGGK